MEYYQLLQKLYACTLHGLKLGLQNALRLNATLGYPTHQLKTIHIAGTNGKGSVATKTARALQASGLKVGLYTSPHIATFRERIVINGEMIDENTVSHLLQEIFAICDKEKIPATFFEITTLLGFKYFAEQYVDIAVIETGLGGRLDATNIITPLLAVITSISLEHTEILGNTLESIALEKAGIIKPKIPVIIGPRVPSEIIHPIALERQSPYHQVTGAFADFEEENSAIAKKALEQLHVPTEAIVEGLQHLPKCRLEAHHYQHCRVILDVAHNPDGLEQLFKAIKRRYPEDKIRVVAAFSSNKDIAACLRILLAHAEHLYLTEANHPRAALVKDLKHCVTDCSRITLMSDLTCSVKNCLEEAARHHQITIICGTFFIMAEARKILGITEPTDYFPLTDYANSKKM